MSNNGIVLGDARESFIRDVLTRFLPQNVVVGTGQIVDQSNNYSKQVDVIVYRGDFPVLRTLGSLDVYFIEGVLATIEVKSKLDEEKLFEALDNCKSVRSLRPTFLRQSLDDYSELVYENKYDDLSVTEKNSVMGMVLPPAYIFSYKGYTKKSIESFKASLNSWHLDFERGEHDVTVFPEVIASEGCVSVKNLNNQLGLRKATEKEMMPIVSCLNSQLEENLTYNNYCECVGVNPEEGFCYGAGVKEDEAPLQYLIASMLELIISRVGLQQLGGTPITYNLIGYHMISDMEGPWDGIVVNATDVKDPKLDFFQKISI
ncbi:DUF6602 domain-containing protein [Litchfieldella rifensis]|uniref:DUF6602 domain-containing protein n=1 Tax=Litchfieldella rifensis TaxID=762643 RepID=A0ABV7LRB2_9GAMM